MCSASGHDPVPCASLFPPSPPPKTVKPEDRKTRLRRREMCTARTICAQNMQKRAPHLSNQSYTPPSWPI